jgi:hypothetical protein
MLLLAWIENNLIVLGLASVLLGVMLGILCSVFQARRDKAALRQTTASRIRSGQRPAEDSGSPRESGDRSPLQSATVRRIHSVPEQIARTGPRRRTRPLARYGR